MTALFLPAFAFADPGPRLELADSVVLGASQTVTQVVLDDKPLPFSALATTSVSEGAHTVRFEVERGGPSRVLLAPCAGKVQPSVRLDGAPISTHVGPAGQHFDLDAGRHTVELSLQVSGYEKRVACGAPPRVGPLTWSEAGLRELRYPSTRPRGSCERCRPGQALVFVPRTVAEGAARGTLAKGAPLLLGLHPWNGALETYAAYMQLLEAAEREGVVLLFADGLGNSLYTKDAEDEVMAALDAMIAVFPIDRDRVSIFGASMGGAGATTVGFHRPDRFAGITSLFGDSKYDLSSYVRRLLPSEADAVRVNALDVVENVRNVPVVLVHGDADKSSKIEQSEWLEQALRRLGYTVRFDRKPGRGHEGRLVSELADDMVHRAATERRVTAPTRVSYRSVRATDVGAYGVSFRKTTAMSFLDLERRADHLQVHACSGIGAIDLEPGALGASANLPVRFAVGVNPVPVRWGAEADR